MAAQEPICYMTLIDQAKPDYSVKKHCTFDVADFYNDVRMIRRSALPKQGYLLTAEAMIRSAIPQNE